MEQEKIGKFIAQLCKEKNMTQKDLAEKIGVTDRAISKWENGRGMPELSLIKTLCEELEISVNELLSGEKIDKADYQEKLEENMLNTIEYANKKMERKSRIFLCVVIVVIFLGLTGAWMLFDSVFPKAGPIEHFRIDMVESVAVYDNENNVVDISEAEKGMLITFLNDAESTRKMSVNDYPTVRPYYVLEIEVAERVYRYMIYEEHGTVYAEVPYEGVYRIDREAIYLLK